MTGISLPAWFSITLIVFTIGTMVGTAYWVENQYGKTGPVARKMWLRCGSISGISVLPVDFLAIGAILKLT